MTRVISWSYPSTPHPTFPTYPRTVRSLRTFTMAPCAAVERLEVKQRCSRAAVSKHAGIQARKWSSWLFTNNREVNWKNDQTLNSPHTITTARRTDNIPLICTGAGPIHPVHSQPMPLATEALPETRLHFCHFPAVCLWRYSRRDWGVCGGILGVIEDFLVVMFVPVCEGCVFSIFG